MSFADFNTTFETIDWGVDTTDFEYKKCEEFVGTEVHVRGLFITPDKGYGLGAVAITDDCLLNLPQRYVDVVKNVLADDEAVEEIKAGKTYFNVTTFDSKKYKNKGYNLEFLVK